ncbi:DUF3015 family protein [Nitrospira defluvii]|nr:DUF3015 family protein [Nitrospira defluvii]
MKRLFVLAIFGLTLVFASNSFAAGYGAAGCGFGGELIKENKILHQIGAAILNGILGNQTFGITSGTSGCGESGLVLAESEQERFVENNYDTLAKEMASGEGENLTTLAGLLGCSSAQVQSFGSFTQSHYPSIFKTGETTPSEMLVALKDGLSLEPTLAVSCQKI